MKTLFTTFCLVIGFSSWSQQYLNQTAVWNQTFSLSGPVTSQVSYIKYYITGDSTYQGKTYYKVFNEVITLITKKELDTIGQPVFVTDTFKVKELGKMLREENKQFITLESNGSEKVLYDFNVNVGDLVSKAVSHSCTPTDQFVFNNYDTVCIGNKARKRWWFSMVSYLSATSLIEGVGPNTGIFNPICNTTCPECSFFLQSFILNGDTLYKGNCTGNVGIVERKTQEEVQLAMLDDAIQVSLTGNFDIALYQITGGLVYQVKAVENKHLIKYKGVFPAGVYLLQLNNGGIQYAKKVIIAE